MFGGGRRSGGGMALEGVSMSSEQEMENGLYGACGSEKVCLVGGMRSKSR